jgi:hypothetical protein
MLPGIKRAETSFRLDLWRTVPSQGAGCCVPAQLCQRFRRFTAQPEPSSARSRGVIALTLSCHVNMPSLSQGRQLRMSDSSSPFFCRRRERRSCPLAIHGSEESPGVARLTATVLKGKVGFFGEFRWLLGCTIKCKRTELQESGVIS